MMSRDLPHRRCVIAWLSVCSLLAACSGAATASSSIADPHPGSGPSMPQHLPGRLLFLNFGGTPYSTLWTTRPGSTHMVQITHSRFNIWSPAISPDGTQIAFNRSRGPHYSDVLVLAKPDGSDQRMLHSLCGHSCTFFDEMTWTPDGQTLLVLMATGVRPGLTGAVWSIRIDGSHRTQLTFPGPSNSEGGFDDHHPSVAPDGASFVFDRIDESTGRHTTEISSIDGGAPVVVPIPDDLNPGDPTWTPDGSRILFQSPPEPTPGHAQNFYTILPDGTGLQQITHYEDAPGKYVGVFHPCFSPDGRYFSASELIGNDRPGDIAIYTANGHRILRMPSPLVENNVVWGPSG
jgi:TolB protein